MKKEKKYNFEKFESKKRILTEVDKEIMRWLIRSKVPAIKIINFTNLRITYDHIKKIKQSITKGTGIVLGKER